MTTELVRRETVGPVIDQVGQQVMPFYILCDTSLSMAKHMDVLNDSLKRLHRKIFCEPLVYDVARIAIMSFSDTASIRMPLQEAETVPVLEAEGGTNYGAAFRLLTQTLEADIAALKSQGLKVFRPCAFLLTDGAPTDDDWEQTFRDTLTFDAATGVGTRNHPFFVPFGFGQADESIIKKLAYPVGRTQAFTSKSADVEKCLDSILEVIMNTVVSSSHTAAPGQTTALVIANPNPAGPLVSHDSDWM